MSPLKTLVRDRARSWTHSCYARLAPARGAAARTRGLDRRRRLRSRRAPPLFRHRRHGAPAEGRLRRLDGALERFLAFLWDIGLEVGHSVRTIDECQRESARRPQRCDDLDRGAPARRPGNLFVAMRRALAPDRSGREGISSKQRSRTGRRATTASTTPPTTSSPTSSRARAACATSRPSAGWRSGTSAPSTLDELVAHGFLTPRELRKLETAQAFLWKVRFALHMLTGRREDRLLFDHQIRLAQHVRLRGRDLHARGRAVHAALLPHRRWT